MARHHPDRLHLSFFSFHSGRRNTDSVQEANAERRRTGNVIEDRPTRRHDIRARGADVDDPVLPVQ